MTVYQGERDNLIATLEPSSVTIAIEWESSNPEVAEVDSIGWVTGIAAGTATITARCGNYTASCEVTVEEDEIPEEVKKNGVVVETDGTIHYYVDGVVDKDYNGMAEDENGRKYWFDYGVAARDKEVYDTKTNAWYWFDTDGSMAVGKDAFVWTNEERTEGKWVRYDKEGAMVKGWDETEYGKYYFDLTTGVMQKGVIQIGENYYYFRQDTGTLVEEYAKETVVDGAWLWFDADGTVAVSKDVYQRSNGGKWVRYNEKAQMVKGWDETEYGKYYFDPVTGAMQKGVVQIDEKSYYFRQDTGVLVEEYAKETVVDGAWLWFDADGTVAVSKDVYQRSSGGKWVRYNEKAQMIKGWDETEHGKYYFDPVTGAMQKGWTRIGESNYYFDPVTGILQQQ